MAILSVSLPPDIEAFIESEIASGRFETKSQVVKRALRKLESENAFDRIIIAEKEMDEGKGLKGDIRKLLKKI